MNTDMTSLYCYVDKTHNDRKRQCWARIIKNNLEYVQRTRSSIWKIINKLEGTYHDIHVKFSLESSANGLLFPTVIVFSGLSGKEMPDKEFTVCYVPGLTVNRHIYIRKKDFSYIYFIRSGGK